MNKYEKIMATRDKYLTTGFRPIPMLFGAEGRRFMERAKNPQKLPREEVERMRKDAEIFKAAIERGKRIREEQERAKICCRFNIKNTSHP